MGKLTPRQQPCLLSKCYRVLKIHLKVKLITSRYWNEFFPLDVVHKETLKLYLRDWTNILTSPVKRFKTKRF